MAPSRSPSRRRYPSRRGPSRHGSRPAVNRPAVRLKPEVDGGLKASFARIGVPAKKAFRPDDYQKKAVAVVGKADCLVTAPTGAGKTWIAVEAIRRVFQSGGSAWYASPLKALTNAKYREFGDIFGAENVGILTGDRKENPDAPIITGTTEILRNQLYDAMHQGRTLATDFVVLDEAHFLGDVERGVVWEEIMIYLPARIPMLLLSATVGNAQQIADWLSHIRQKPCRVVAEHQRPVPLVPLFLHPSGTLLPLVAAGKRVRLHKKVRNWLDARRPPLLAPPHRLPPFDQILGVLKRFNLLPAIFFLKSRADCDSAVLMCRRKDPLTPAHRQRLAARIDQLAGISPRVAEHRQLDDLGQLAVGSHHSGQLPAWKLVVETLMSEGLLEAVFATSTVAAGVNFPARTIVVLNSDRFNGREFLPLTPTEFHQMAGRAGRRGMDRIGFALVLPGRFMDVRLMARLTGAQPSNVDSQIRINFSMVLNLLLSHSPLQVEDLLQRSFAAYQHTRPDRPASARRLVADFRRHLAFLQETGYVDADGTLTGDGRWASQLRIDQPLLVAEGFRDGLFDGVTPMLMAGLMAPFAYDRETEDRRTFGPLTADDLVRRLRKIRQALSPFAHRMIEAGFEVRPLLKRPAIVAFSWAAGVPWEALVRMSDYSEGDLSMLMLRTADNLRHVRALGDTFPEAADAAAEAIERLVRDPIDTGSAPFPAPPELDGDGALMSS